MPSCRMRDTSLTLALNTLLSFTPRYPTDPLPHSRSQTACMITVRSKHLRLSKTLIVNQSIRTSLALLPAHIDLPHPRCLYNQLLP